MSEGRYRNTLHNIEYKVIYSGRRTLGITVLPDSSVVVKVPYLTSRKTINRLVQQKAGWITKHRDNYINTQHLRHGQYYVNGEMHLFRGRKLILEVEKSPKPYVLFSSERIEIGLSDP